MRTSATSALLAALAAATPGVGGEWSGDIRAEARGFVNAPLHAGQRDHAASLAVEAEYYHDWDDGNQRFAFTPFARWDSADPERTHADARELYWRRSFPSLELAVGLRKVFWGVTESQHLVDIINQTDFVENLDTEDKLGQPMVNLTWLSDRGTFDFFLMPYFRERTFPGAHGRLRPPFVVDTDSARYESGAGRQHLDAAVRWSHYFGPLDVGLSHFSGTSREPRLAPALSASGEPVLIPHYDQIDQTGLELQATLSDWLWKLEMIASEDVSGRYAALTGGFEYTFVGVFDSAADLGAIVEYSHDDRGTAATRAFQNDLALGARLALNDEQSSELLGVAGVDLDTDAVFISIEGSRRLGQDWRVYVELRAFTNVPPADFTFGLRDDDYLELSLARFY